jgi:hypothetical protein
VAAGPAASISKWLWQDPLDAAIGFSASSTRPFPNWQHASVPELDGAYQGWLRATSGDELRSAAEHVGRVFAATLPYVPLLTPNDIWVHGAHVHGYRPFPANLYPFLPGRLSRCAGGMTRSPAGSGHARPPRSLGAAVAEGAVTATRPQCGAAPGHLPWCVLPARP